MRTMMLGLGCASPEHAIAQTEFAAAARAQLLFEPSEAQLRLLPTLYRRSGVQRRGSVVLEPADGGGHRQSFFRPAQRADDRGPTTAERMERYAAFAPELAQRAAAAALADAGVAPRTITHLVTVCCTGFAAPGVDIQLIKRLGLRPTTGRIHVGFMGCHGALNGLRVGQALVEADSDARVLLVAVELCSLHLSYGWDPDRIVANALFADGAAAAVLAAEKEKGDIVLFRRENAGAPVLPAEKVQCPLFHQCPLFPPAEKVQCPLFWVRATGSCLLPDSEDAMTWRIGDHGFEMTLSARVPGLIAEHLRPWLTEWLAQHEVALAGVGSWAVHPGGPRIVSSVAEALGLAADAVSVSNAVLADHGNMSSPTILFILDRLRQQDAARPCVVLGFGPGLIAEAALLL